MISFETVNKLGTSQLCLNAALKTCTSLGKTFLVLLWLIGIVSISKGQNLIKNPSFEKYWGPDCSSGFSITPNDVFNGPPPFDCHLQDWIRISETPDGFWYNGGNFPVNELSHYIYPHSDSACVGGVFYIQNMPNLREIIEGRLTKQLITDHHYQFSIYVQLSDSFYWSGTGKIAGINSFSAVFSDTMIASYTDLPIQNYTPQVQINQMVTDTQHWVLLMDTFVAAGGEKYVSIGNFKQDGQFQSQVIITKIPNSARITYYYIDDVSLIDLDDTASGINEQVAVGKLQVYPNPAENQLTVGGNQFSVNTIEVSNVLGQVCIIPPYQGGKGDVSINIAALPSGIYFIKATDAKGNTINGKFVKQ
jgi:hypothetical protein